MRLHNYIPLLALIAALITTPAMADSNATGGGVTNSETVFVGAGPFDHGNAVGNLDNSIVTGLTFTGGFTATHIRFTGTTTSVLAGTWGSEADIQIRQGGSAYTWQNPGPGSAFTTYDFDFGGDLSNLAPPNQSGDFAGGTDPGTGGTWDIEFIDTFDDGGGADSQSTNVNMIFEERNALFDENGVFTLGSLGAVDSANSVGEFALESLFDLYSLTLTSDATISFATDEDPNGFVGTTVDTEIGIFNAAGVLLAEDDDGGNGLYSAISGLFLTAGDYTIAVAPFLSGASFADGFVVNPGTSTGDYILTVTTVPEPGSLAFLAFGCCGLLAYRRRR